MKLSLGFSPCPNDTYIFDAMIHGKIDTEGLTFEVVMDDVAALNQRAFAGELAITKLSYHALAYVLDRYVLLPAGSALGNNCGPLLIAKRTMKEQEIIKSTIAIPGKYTTANFLLSLAYPQAHRKQEMIFSDIENAVLSGAVDLGLIIHENRFTYQDKGLVKVLDLGSYWEDQTGLPIPLGGIVVDRTLPLSVQQRIARVMYRSVAYARANPLASRAFVRAHAQEMEEEVMSAHINLYVNEYTLDLGDRGRAAIHHLFATARAKGVIPTVKKDLFLHIS